jgi:hypothetical protein
MQDIERTQTLLMNALNEYAEKHKRQISRVELGANNLQSERSYGLSLTLDNGKVFQILIFED